SYVCSVAATPHYLHAFPTRRSSDLERCGGFGAGGIGGGHGERELPLCSGSAADCAAGGEAETVRQTAARVRQRRSAAAGRDRARSEEHTSELQSPYDLVCRLLREKK